MITRRGLLASGGLLSYLLLSGRSSAMAGLFFRPKRQGEPRKTPDRFTAADGKALVGVSGKGSVKDKIREAVSLIGGFGKLDLKGKRVLVKPNCVSGEKNPATTNPEVVKAVVEILYEEGAVKVFVGDMSALRTISTLRNMERNGIEKAARAAGAEVVIFEDFGWVEVALPDNLYVKKALVTEWIFSVDTIVNLPVIKTHRSASYSITLKNFIGCTHLSQRPYLIDTAHWEEIVAEFNAAYSPDLNIVDGTVSMIEGGPWSGTPAETGLIIASGDRCAADAVGLGVIKSFGKWEMAASKDIWAQKQIVTAVARGIGKGKGDIILKSGGGDESFSSLMESVRESTGLL